MTKAEVTRRVGDRRWQEYAETLGFGSEAEMLPLLYKTMSTKTLGDLIGVDPATVRFRLRKLRVKMRPRGGPWHTKQNHGKGEYAALTLRDIEVAVRDDKNRKIMFHVRE